MVIQAVEPTGASAVGLSLAAPMYRPTTTGNVNARAEVMMGESGNVPPPPVLRPGSPSTPMQRTSAGCNATPGGTPVPPPPPPTPATASRDVQVQLLSREKWRSQASWSQSCHLFRRRKEQMRQWWRETGWRNWNQVWQVSVARLQCGGSS